MEGLYLYGIVGFPPPLRGQIQGLGGRRAFLVPCGDLAGLVTRSQLRPWPLTEQYALRHEAVVAEVMDSRPILPVRFNTVLPGQATLIGLLEHRASAFRAALTRVAGKVELGLRVLWEPPVDGERPAVHGVPSDSPGTRYIARRLAEEHSRARLRAAGEEIIRTVHTRLRSVAVESWTQRFPTDRILLAGAYLVPRDHVGLFRHAVARAHEDFPGVHFLLTGVWPPYHFVAGGKK